METKNNFFNLYTKLDDLRSGWKPLSIEEMDKIPHLKFLAKLLKRMRQGPIAVVDLEMLNQLINELIINYAQQEYLFYLYFELALSEQIDSQKRARHRPTKHHTQQHVQVIRLPLPILDEKMKYAAYNSSINNFYYYELQLQKIKFDYDIAQSKVYLDGVQSQIDYLKETIAKIKQESDYANNAQKIRLVEVLSELVEQTESLHNEIEKQMHAATTDIESQAALVNSQRIYESTREQIEANFNLEQTKDVEPYLSRLSVESETLHEKVEQSLNNAADIFTESKMKIVPQLEFHTTAAKQKCSKNIEQILSLIQGNMKEKVQDSTISSQLNLLINQKNQIHKVHKFEDLLKIIEQSYKILDDMDSILSKELAPVKYETFKLAQQSLVIDNKDFNINLSKLIAIKNPELPVESVSSSALTGIISSQVTVSKVEIEKLTLNERIPNVAHHYRDHLQTMRSNPLSPTLSSSIKEINQLIAEKKGSGEDTNPLKNINSIQKTILKEGIENIPMDRVNKLIEELEDIQDLNIIFERLHLHLKTYVSEQLEGQLSYKRS